MQLSGCTSFYEIYFSTWGLERSRIVRFGAVAPITIGAHAVSGEAKGKSNLLYANKSVSVAYWLLNVECSLQEHSLPCLSRRLRKHSTFPPTRDAPAGRQYINTQHSGGFGYKTKKPLAPVFQVPFRGFRGFGGRRNPVFAYLAIACPSAHELIVSDF